MLNWSEKPDQFNQYQEPANGARMNYAGQTNGMLKRM